MASVLGAIERGETLLTLGLLAIAVWYVASGKFTEDFPSLADLWPKGISPITPTPGTEIQDGPVTYGNTTSNVLYSVQGGSKAITIRGAAGNPLTYSNSSAVPGTGQTVNELRTLGYTDQEIANLLFQADTTDLNSVMASDGAGGSF